MKKTAFLFLVFSFTLLANSFAAPSAFAKLNRGIINVVTSPVEIPKQVRWAWITGSAKTMHISAWLFYGFVKGLWMAPTRLASGLWDVLTFPVDSNAPSLIQPPNVFDDWPKRQQGVFYHNLWD